MNFKDIFKKFKEKFLKFWRSENTKISLVRDVFIALLLVLIILSALWAYTGQWFGTPMVAIESGSMMHENEPFGRYGTIDAGDMVFLVKVNSKNDISTYIEKDPDNYHYQNYGDVIVYRPYGDPNLDQIIHRAMCWVEYNEEYDTYTVEGYGVENESSITISELGLYNYAPRNPHSGFLCTRAWHRPRGFRLLSPTSAHSRKKRGLQQSQPLPLAVYPPRPRRAS